MNLFDLLSAAVDAPANDDSGDECLEAAPRVLSSAEVVMVAGGPEMTNSGD